MAEVHNHDLFYRDAQTDPLTRQVGGDHYVKLAIQPAEFAQRNRWDAIGFSILKYTTRYPDKGVPIADLEKALHFTEMRRAIGGPRIAAVGGFHFTMREYTGRNGITGPQADALFALDDLVMWGDVPGDNRTATLIGRLQTLLVPYVSTWK